MVDIRTKARGKGIRLTRNNQGKRVKKTNEALRKEINLRNLAAMKNRVTQAAATMRTCRQLVKNRSTCATKKSSPMMRRASTSSSPSTYEASYYGARGSTWSRNAPESYITT